MNIQENEVLITPVRNWRTTGSLPLNLLTIVNLKTYVPGDDIYWALFHADDEDKYQIINGVLSSPVDALETEDLFNYILEQLNLSKQ